MVGTRSGSALFGLLACVLVSGCATGGQAGSAAPSTALSASTKLRLAKAAEAGGDTDMASAIYGSLGAEDGTTPAVRMKVADGLLRAGRVPEADQVLSGASSSTADPDLLLMRSTVRILLGRAPQALPELDQVLVLRPDDPRALVNKAIALDLMDRHADAQALYRRVLARSPDDAEIRTNLAISLMLDGQAGAAQQAVAGLRDDRLPSQRVRNNIAMVNAANASNAANAAPTPAGDGGQAQMAALVQANPRPRVAPVKTP